MRRVFRRPQLAGVLLLWHRLFGTCQRERSDDQVVYGLTTNIDSYGTWTIATHEYRDMFADVAASTSWRDRLGYVLRTPGWAHRRRNARLAATAAE